MSLMLLTAALIQAQAADAVPVRNARPIGGSVSADDYPQAEARAGIGGTTIVRTQISERGRITACVVTASSRSSALDSATCGLLQRRFRFRPAEDAAGRAVSQWLVTRWTWRAPGGIVLEEAFQPEQVR